MGIAELILLAVGLSMDAFAVAVCLGLGISKSVYKKALVIGLYFGIFQAGMPLIGYFTAKIFAGYVTSFAHWIAFCLLLLLGLKMILESSPKKECSQDSLGTSVSPKKVLPLALATSIDALAVGISLALVNAEIFSSIAIIGVVTFALSIAGVKIGNLFGEKIKSKAEIIGGIILMLIGVKILLGHFGVIGF